ncbi:hypothetical protein [Arthrobacter sp. CAN_C5]|uniref:hypothetical protein n=1 Tax=Arthrobacter sp. CAN_C5 TaxID=2760706 RepID=UPI001FDAB1AC|nr:hypothetical protein [Arthrobacter sp. CAN_C5]MBP2217466.1 tetratricopeptide (TPR) repeat protein [Arthrobacter sp. CAN_C5]
MADQDRNQGADRADRRPDRTGTQGGRSFGKQSDAPRGSGSRDDRSAGYRGARPTTGGTGAPRDSQRDGQRGGSSTGGRSAGGFSAGRGAGATRGPRDENRGGSERTETGKRSFNARDLRSANRPDRERSPNIDEDVTGAELDRVTRAQIRNLEEKSAEWVARHLVMAGRLLEDEPELAFQHALAASRRGGRLAVVREAVGLTAYAAGHYGEALREFRTYRRISGSNDHLPVMADCERGLGRPDRALDLARSEEAEGLSSAGKAELAMVVSGARTDLGQFDAAVGALEISQLDRNRAFSYSPRLFRAYAEALAAVGRTAEADQWRRQAGIADSALGLGDFAEPDIFDLAGDDEEIPDASAAKRRVASAPASSPGNAPLTERQAGQAVDYDTDSDDDPDDAADSNELPTVVSSDDDMPAEGSEPAPGGGQGAEETPGEDAPRAPVTWRSLNRPAPVRARTQPTEVEQHSTTGDDAVVPAGDSATAPADDDEQDTERNHD